MAAKINPRIARTIVGTFALLISALPGEAQQGPAPQASAQQRTAPQATPASLNELLTYFYKDPRLERLNGFVQRFQERPDGEKWDAFPPVTGFLAAICTSHPDRFPKLIPADLKPKMATSIGAAMRLCGNPQVAVALRPALERAALDEQLKTAYTGLPARLSDLKIASPTHLDILWGASFATGLPRHVAPIVEYFAQAANQSEAVALDIAQTAVEMMGGPKGTVAQLRGKYGDEQARRMIYAATALWALQSNARQHVFVDQLVTKYIAEHPGTHATKALAALRPRGSRT